MDDEADDDSDFGMEEEVKVTKNDESMNAGRYSLKNLEPKANRLDKSMIDNMMLKY